MDPLALLVSLFTGGWGANPVAQARSWGVCYGRQATLAALRQPDLLVLEPDFGWDPHQIRRSGQKILAYLSVGEIHHSRRYYPALAAIPGLLQRPNPNWKGAIAVDPRSAVWRDLVIDRLVPDLLAQGYDGFFLDTVDAGYDLESREHLEGAGAAMANLVCGIRSRAPQSVLISNGGISLLPRTASALSGLAVESVFTDYDFSEQRYQWRDAEGARQRRWWVATQRERYGLPVFVLEYVDPQDASMRAEATRRTREAGFVPCVADIGLNQLSETP